MNKNLLILVGALIIIAVAVGAWFAFGTRQAAPVVVTPTPVTPQITYVNASADNIVVTSPIPGAVTGKSFTVTGKARGPWYFEASFPVEVKDPSGNTLATGVAQAQGDWMTTDFVPFSVAITIPGAYQGPATLILKKDNPSAEPQNDASMSFPITI